MKLSIIVLMYIEREQILNTSEFYALYNALLFIVALCLCCWLMFLLF